MTSGQVERMIVLFERLGESNDKLLAALERLIRAVDGLADSQSRARYDAQVLGSAVEEQIAIARATAAHLGVQLSDDRSYVPAQPRRDD